MTGARDAAEFRQLPGTVPGWAVRAAFAVVAVALALTAAPSGPWPIVCVVLAAISVAVPRWRTAWVLIAVLAFSILVEPPTGVSVRVLVLIAGAHALHVLAAWMLAVPPRARLQPTVLRPGLRRFAIIQVPVQAVAVAVLVWAHPVAGGLPAIAAGAAVLALGALLGMLLLRRPQR